MYDVLGFIIIGIFLFPRPVYGIDHPSSHHASSLDKKPTGIKLYFF